MFFTTEWNLIRRSLTEIEKDISDVFDCPKPASNLYDDGTKIVVEMEIPGFGIENVEITLDNYRLIVEGKPQSGSGERKYHLAERTNKSFTRSFFMPESIDSDKVEASYKDGILTIHIPKRQESISKKVEIKAI
jgi:HSP20 family protein